MANKAHISAGLQVARDGTADTGSNTFHLSAGLPPEVSSGSAVTIQKIYGSAFSKIYGITPSKIMGVDT